MARAFEATRQDLVASFFEAAALPGRWAAALTALARAFRSDSATMGIWPVDRGAPAMLEMIGPLASGRGPYLDYFQTVDPHVAVVAAPHRGWALHGHPFDEGYGGRSEDHNGFLR